MKRICAILVVILISMVALTSCAEFEKDPYDMKKDLLRKDFYVEMLDDEDEIEEIADEFEIRSKGIECIVFCENEEEGYFIYCDKISIAKKAEEDLWDLIDEYDMDDAILKRDGKIIYFGSEENWEAIY